MSAPPLYHHYSPATQRSTEIVEDEPGTLTFVHSQNTRPIVEQCKREAAAFDPLVRRDTVKVASIPLVIWRQLERLGITRDEKSFYRWLNDPDNSVFRCDDRSTL